MRKKANLFICSKPLQYFNLTNIEKLDDYPNILVIENDFIDANLFVERVRLYDKSWHRIVFIKNGWPELLLFISRFRIQSLYYYMDCYLYPALIFNLIPFKTLLIYEEGYGTYCTDIFSSLNNFKVSLRKLLKIPDRPGLHNKTKAVYVYAPNFYKKVNNGYLNSKTILSFKKTFLGMVNSNLAFSKMLFPLDDNFIYNLKNMKIGFYLSSWNVDFDFLARVNYASYDVFFVKLHPHITKLPPDINAFKEIKIINSNILVEFLIQSLLTNKNIVDLYHDNSSALIYFEEIQNLLTMYNIGIKNVEYEKIVVGIKNIN